MKCPKCNMDTELITEVFDEENFVWIKVTPFYKCKICKEEFYDLGNLRKG